MDHKKRSESLTESLNEVVTPELCATAAKAYRRMVDALVVEGFTKEEAIDIVAEQGFSFVVK